MSRRSSGGIEFRRTVVKSAIKEILLDVGLYYKINAYRFRNERSASQKAFYAGLINKEDLVFDVGANVGQRTEIFSELAGRVVAFEPQSECVRHLNSRLRRKKNVIVEQVALSDKEGDALFYQSNSHTLSSMSRKFIARVSKDRFKDYRWDAEVRVKTKTLDQMIARYSKPKFIKIDVEGFEVHVLGGLTQAVSNISFECTPELIEETTECVRLINNISRNYMYNYCEGEVLDFVLAEHLDYLRFTTEVLPKLGEQVQFVDIYAILG
jgi:FkbM family methyltransferase